MHLITVTQQIASDSGWKFTVTIGNGKDSTTHQVSLSKKYWQQLTNGQREPDQLVQLSFEFLLAREPKESILRRFDLRLIATYFPQYEEEIKQGL